MISSQTTAIPKLFIGMDVHKKSWTVHFKTDLFDNKTVTMPTEAAVLINYVEKHFPDHEVSCCYEAGCCGYWIARALQQHGWQVSVVNPADVPRINKQDWQKTDKIDSRRRAGAITQFIQKACSPGSSIKNNKESYQKSVIVLWYKITGSIR